MPENEGESIDFVNDGRIDRLTGLDAPEIFYRTLSKALAASSRNPENGVGILRIFMANPSHGTQGERTLLELANFLRSRVRGDETLSRIGRRTFALLFRVNGDIAISHGSDREAVTLRFRSEIEEWIRTHARAGKRKGDGKGNPEGERTRGKEEEPCENEKISVEISSVQSTVGEEMLELLARAGV